MADERKCYRCIWCEKVPSSKCGWYCNHKRGYVYYDEWCGYFEAKF